MDFPEAFRHYVLHWTPDRAIYIGGHPVPWDARCAGIYTGFGVALLWMLLRRRRAGLVPSLPVLALHALLCVPFVLDVATLWAGLRAPSNHLRFLTGILLGGGFCLVLYPAFLSLALPGFARPQRLELDGWHTTLLAALCAAFGLRYVDTAVAWAALTSVMALGFGAVAFFLAGNLTALLLGLAGRKR